MFVLIFKLILNLNQQFALLNQRILPSGQYCCRSPDNSYECQPKRLKKLFNY